MVRIFTHRTLRVDPYTREIRIITRTPLSRSVWSCTVREIERISVTQAPEPDKRQVLIRLMEGAGELELGEGSSGEAVRLAQRIGGLLGIRTRTF